MNLQIEYENIYRDIAEKISDGPTVILCDRGIQDAWAYMSKEMREIIKNQYNWNQDMSFNMRYDCTIHMVTSADGAEEYYSLSGNVARHENAETARRIDKII
jgi:hypothetical protein